MKASDGKPDVDGRRKYCNHGTTRRNHGLELQSQRAEDELQSQRAEARAPNRIRAAILDGRAAIGGGAVTDRGLGVLDGTRDYLRWAEVSGGEREAPALTQRDGGRGRRQIWDASNSSTNSNQTAKGRPAERFGRCAGA